MRHQKRSKFSCSLKFARSLKTTSNNYHHCGWTWQLGAPHITGSHGNPVAGSATFSSPSSSSDGPSFGVGNCSNKLSRTYTGNRYDMGGGENEGERDRVDVYRCREISFCPFPDCPPSLSTNRQITRR